MFHYGPLAKIRALLLAALVIGSLSSAYAVSIQDRHGTKLLLKLDGTSVEKGDRFLAVDSDGKRRALIEISQIKDDEAVAHVLKGTFTQPLETYTLQSVKELRAAKTESAGEPAAESTAATSSDESAPPSTPALPTESETSKRKVKKSTWNIHGRGGGLVGISQNSMKVKLTGSSSLNMAGNGLSAEAFYEGSFSSRFQMLLRGGLQTLKATGTLSSAACGGSSDCNLDITYISTEGLVKYMIGSKNMATWLGGGVGLLVAASKSSNVVDVEKIGFTQKLILSAGGQISLDGGAFIPFQLDYTLFPNSTSVTISQIFLRVGYGFKF